MVGKKELKVDIVPAMRRLEIAFRELVKTGTAGAYRSGFRGQGLEFEEFKRYNPGEDASKIDWVASKKANVLLMRKYVEERNLQVFFLVDSSDSMVFGSTDKLKVEYAAELVASLAHAILEAGDNIGFALFSNNAIAKITPNRGSHQFYALTKNLLNPDNYGGSFDFGAARKFLLNYLPPQAIVLIVSDFTTMKGDWESDIRLLANKFNLTGVMIRDPRDETMPEDVNQVLIEDPATGRSMLVEPRLIKYAYEREAKKREIEVKEAFMRSRSSFLKLKTDESFIGPLITFFRRQALGGGWQ